MAKSPEHQARMKWARDLVSNVVIPPADAYCECEDFNHAVNEEVIFWDAADEDNNAAWRMDMNGHLAQLNFCPFCGKLVPLTAHSGGVKS